MSALTTIQNFFSKKPQGKMGEYRYKGAKLNEQDPWVTHNLLVNQLISTASPRLRSRVRDLVRNFPIFTRAVTAYSAFMVGPGPKFQSLAVNFDGSPNEELRNKIESSFERWMEHDADISGRLHFFELQHLLCRQLLETGESFFQFTHRKKYKQNPLALLPIEADRLVSYSSIKPKQGNEFAHGLEYVENTGEVLAYHVAFDELGTKVIRVPASDMLHVYQTLRPGQLRGVTPLAPAIVFARAMSEYVGSELEAQKLASRYLSFITSPDIEGFQAARGLLGTKETAQEPRIDYVENALIEYLRPGEEIKFADMPNRPGQGFGQFESYTTRMTAICVNLSYEVLSGDYQKINYSQSKAIRGDNSLFLAPDRFMHEYRSLRPTFFQWLQLEALTKDYIPSYFWQNPELIERHSWSYKERPTTDPVRDATADIKLLEAGLKSPQEIILARGGDPEKVIAEIAKFNSILGEHNVALKNHVATPLANNPAALGASDNPEKI